MSNSTQYKQMSTAVIGMDVGNYDTKTQQTTTPSSFKASPTPNLLAGESIYYKDTYYFPTTERNNQQLDKTLNDYCLIMSLFGIAKEIIWQVTESYKTSHVLGKNEAGEVIYEWPSPLQVQKEINKITEIILGVGLPAGHYSSLMKKTTDCYLNNWSNGFTFTYTTTTASYEFNLKLASCATFPQDFTAVAFNENVKIVNDFQEYYIIGIGGGTVDIIPVANGAPQIEKCRTLEKGTTVMYEYISAAVQQETGKTLDYNSIEAVLTGKPTIIDEKRKARIRELTAEFVNKIIDELVHIGLKLSDFPCVFVGGGALMMKEPLQANPMIAMSEFIEDTHVNAKFYAAFASDDE